MSQNSPCDPYHYGILTISPGDLADKLVILQIKREKIENLDSGYFIQDEICRTSIILDIILNFFSQEVYDTFLKLQNELRSINLEQWALEDRVRTESSWEAAKAARECNTKRVKKKNEINELLGYPVETKQYQQKP